VSGSVSVSIEKSEVGSSGPAEVLLLFDDWKTMFVKAKNKGWFKKLLKEATKDNFPRWLINPL